MSDNGYVDIIAAGSALARESDLAFVVTDPAQPDNPIVFASPRFSEHTGYLRADALKVNCRFLQGPETDEADIEAIRGAIRDAEPLAIDIVNYRKDGERFLNRLVLVPMPAAGRRRPYFIGFQNVIEETERMEGPVNGMARVAALFPPVRWLLENVEAA